MPPRYLPYIGVTGFSSKEEVDQITWLCHHRPSKMYVMFGFTSSLKRLLNPLSTGETSPSLLDLNDLVYRVHRNHLPMIHYYTSEPDTLADQVHALFDYCKLDLHSCGLQLNLKWPDPKELAKIATAESKITLQLPKIALNESDTHIVEHLKQYQGLIQYVLIDPSGGTGSDVDLVRAASLIQAITGSVEGITPGIAGGFDSANVQNRIFKLRGLLGEQIIGKKTPNFCVDAQGKLRKNHLIPVPYPKNADPLTTSKLDIEHTIQYIDNAYKSWYLSLTSESGDYKCQYEKL